MRVPRLVAGAILSVTGLVAFLLDAGVSTAGPQLPDSPSGYVGWLLVLVGLGLLRAGVST